MTINPVATAAGTIVITIQGTSTATYGAANDYTTTPAGPTTITIPVALGDASASFDVVVNDDAITETDEVIIFKITAATGGIALGATLIHTLTITDNDAVPTVNFTTVDPIVLENVGTQTFNLSFTPTTHAAGSMTIQVVDGPGSVYGTDYTTTPAVVGGVITVSFLANAATASFSVGVINDLLPESSELVTFTVTGVPTGFAIGTADKSVLTIGDNDSPSAVLSSGDLLVVGVNANDNSCSSSLYDEVSFFCFKEITYGTEIIITDNGYERCNTGGGTWGNQEGAVKMTRTGPGIPAGQVVTFRFTSAIGSGQVVSLFPDASWTCTVVGTAAGAPFASTLALNTGGEQLFFLQGTWNPGTYSGTYQNNATFSGTVLFAFNTKPTAPKWVQACDNQTSNLPPGVECFSMAPTSAADYNKYKGPLTLASQRDWIIRVGDIANWAAPSGCSAYHALLPDWHAAPILPIITGGMTAGLWRGAKNTDWFECKNWDDARVPTATTDVVINQDATRACDIGIVGGVSPAGTAYCASVLQTSNTTAVPYLILRDNSTLNIYGRLRIQHTAGTGLLYTSLYPGATLNVDSVNISGSTPSAITEAALNVKFLGTVANVSGNLVIGDGGYFDMKNALGTSGTLNLGGNFINKQDQTHFLETYGQFNVTGAGAQSLTTSTGTENFYNLRLNKPSGDLTVNNPVKVQNSVDFLSGHVFTSAANLLTFVSGVAATNMSNASYVNGPVERLGSAALLTFPVGKLGYYRPISLVNMANATSITGFIGEYFNSSTFADIGSAHQPVLDHVSDCEYWTMNRNGVGSPNARIQLTWEDPVSCGVTLVEDLRTAYWDEVGGLWIDKGSLNATPLALSGSIETTNVESAFPAVNNYWTLASLSRQNPLPIELLSFTALANGDRVDLAWATASEKDNDHFNVERSADAVTFEPISQVSGAGNSQGVLHYTDVDRQPLPGLSYYRLRQTDFNGTATVSPAVPVFFNRTNIGLTVLYGGNGLVVAHDFAPGSHLEVLDLAGRMVAQGMVSGEGLMPVPTEALAHGAYVLRLFDASRSESTRFAW
ncbi:MAG: hypothetical protein ACOH13_15320 [Flavobacteriales bacterium]